MAKIANTNIVFTVSKLVKDEDSDAIILDNEEEVLSQLSEVLEHLLGTSFVVESSVVNGK